MLPKADQPQDETHDACQGRQARNPGSDVTATAGTNSFQQVVPKFRSNLTWHLNMLAVIDLPRSHEKESKKDARESEKRTNGSKYDFSDRTERNCTVNS